MSSIQVLKEDRQSELLDSRNAAESSAVADDQFVDKEKSAVEKTSNKPTPVSFFQLFRYASGVDWIYISLGTLAALTAGCSLPFSICLSDDSYPDFR